jgi:hypothetical protein
LRKKKYKTWVKKTSFGGIFLYFITKFWENIGFEREFLKKMEIWSGFCYNGIEFI